MRTTVRLDDHLLSCAKKEAMRRNTTLTALIEQGLRMVLAQPASNGPKKKITIPVSHAGGGVLPGIDINNSAQLLAIMEDTDW